MKFLANENFPFTSYKMLKNQQWDIVHISEGNAGISDGEVIEYSKKEERVIITFDSDYGELVFKQGLTPQGVIYLRIKKFSAYYPAQLLHQLIVVDKLEVAHKFTVVDEHQIRQRNL